MSCLSILKNLLPGLEHTCFEHACLEHACLEHACLEHAGFEHTCFEVSSIHLSYFDNLRMYEHTLFA
jgi:hypothetical protein